MRIILTIIAIAFLSILVIGLTIKTENQFNEISQKDSIILAKNKLLVEQLEALQVYTDSIEYLQLDNNWLRYMIRSKSISLTDTLQRKRIDN
jgi:hypothetical protein